ncbi:type VI secretion system-associated FHA domain protein TagH [Pectobacterium zantedeschiae]|uniref:Type VI secretion system-associated FHA domain protein TagH n=1 Tax=Pectobacterium zantedeschiae TaxID=2034769 RepID=A0A9X8JK58_9GAMM|nr:type VI secretion system-associated FHA domain protein TagH [Pectobacterium zantedeschiae]RYC44313.1 type VI secretion system-associated FHA domain protein TagH [Pectobacterium zantedeschiae]RYC49472.1 type VI secretion system-associated FHA domain protein TagH [Pectobacterium zantedeschiae]
MRFTIITTKPGHQPPQICCDFLPPGGTIGRGVDNNLVLPDDDRTISRLQAIVHITANGECRLTNRGNVTRVQLNDIPLERGSQVELQDGDVLRIGDYQLLVNDFNNAPQLQAAPVAPSPVVNPTIIADEPLTEKASNTAAIPSEIWDSLTKEFSISDDLSTHKNTVPEQPMANPLTAPAGVERNPEDPLAQLLSDAPLNIGQPSQNTSLFDEGDALFARESIFDDRTPSTLSAQQNAAAQPQMENRSTEIEPLSLFGNQSSTDARSHDDPLGLMMDNAVPLTQPETLVAKPEQPEPIAEAHSGSVPVELADLCSSPLFDNTDMQATSESLSSREPEPEQHETVNPQMDYGGITLPTPQAVPRTLSPTPKGRLRIDPVTSSTQADTSTEGSAVSQSSGDLLKGDLLDALLEGMGLRDLQSTPQFDREQMLQFGQMLSMFSQGTVALLSSRSILKRGVKADMTMILDDANNPFKLLPSGKTVLIQMFGSRMPGFMPPRQAVRDALIDLQAHQLGMIAGIRAIIASMLQSFNPDQLEEEARQAGAVSRLGLPGSRKAALWEHFVERYGETAGEIEDDFHTLFGEAFLHAYDLEVNQYKDSQTHTDAT